MEGWQVLANNRNHLGTYFMSFVPQQRYTSEGEPELGVGIVTDVRHGRVQIHFPGAQVDRLYATDNAPLIRVRFKTGDTIRDQEQQTMVVERVQEGDLLLYIGPDRVISEADLGNVSVQHGVDDRLLRGDVDPPRLFTLRRQTLEHEYARRNSPIQGFVGGRIDLIPHQLYIAQEVSSRYAPRVLLSDEVGLGKTIEACLILHRLLLSGRINRVLILVPESLLHQWFVELLRRFNLWFHIFDEARCRALEEGAPQGNPFLDDQLILCSTDFLASSPKRAKQALLASWDMLIVDEAHHLEWSIDQVSPAYQIVDLLSKTAEGLLLLTATPEQLGIESHFARLRLLDPDRYGDFDTFREEQQSHQAIASLVEKLEQGNPLAATDEKWLAGHFDPAKIQDIKEGDDLLRRQLIDDLLDQYGPGRVIFRNTRAAMHGFPQRKPILAPLQVEGEGKALWIDRLSEEFKTDLVSEPGETPTFYFKHDPRVEWLVKLMSQLATAKVLLICRSKEKVLELEAALSRRVQFKLGVFHEDLTIVQRDRNAAWFADQDGARLMLCSEIGSEGRNFQFAHHLVLFDLPINPELLEQRIGRLDRIGQTEDIHIHIPYLAGSPQEVLVRWYHEGLQAFAHNLEGGNQIREQFGEQLQVLSLGSPSTERTQSIEVLIKETAAFQSQLKAKLAQGRDRLLERNSYRPQVAERIIAEIEAADRDLSLEQYMTRVFEEFAVEMEDLGPRSYLLYPAPQSTETFPGIPREGLAVSFSRTWALSREDASFLSWDHPLTTGTLDMVLSSGTGGASFGRLRDEQPGLLLEAVFVLETIGGESLHVDRFLPPTPIRVVVDQAGLELSAAYPSEALDQRIISSPIDQLLDNEVIVETLIPNMISYAKDMAEVQGASHIVQGLRRMRQTLDHEVDRLKALHTQNPLIRPEEIRMAQDTRRQLDGLIQDAGIRLDALRLIWRGS